MLPQKQIRDVEIIPPVIDVSSNGSGDDIQSTKTSGNYFLAIVFRRTKDETRETIEGGVSISGRNPWLIFLIILLIAAVIVVVGKIF